MTKDTENLLVATHISPVCEYHTCEQESSKVYHGVSQDGTEITSFIVTYCTEHAENHAAAEKWVHYFGEIVNE
jgi:hypothetical protein